MWEDLSMSQRHQLMKIYLGNGVSSLDQMREHYNRFSEGGRPDIPPYGKVISSWNSNGRYKPGTFYPDDSWQEIDINDRAYKDFRTTSAWSGSHDYGNWEFHNTGYANAPYVLNQNYKLYKDRYGNIHAVEYTPPPTPKPRPYEAYSGYVEKPTFNQSKPTRNDSHGYTFTKHIIPLNGYEVYESERAKGFNIDDDGNYYANGGHLFAKGGNVGPDDPPSKTSRYQIDLSLFDARQRMNNEPDNTRVERVPPLYGSVEEFKAYEEARRRQWSDEQVRKQRDYQIYETPNQVELAKKGFSSVSDMNQAANTERQVQEAMTNAGEIIESVIDFTPVIGDVKGLTFDVARGALGDGWEGAKEAAALGLVGLIPFGDLAKGAKRYVRGFSLFDPDIIKMLESKAAKGDKDAKRKLDVIRNKERLAADEKSIPATEQKNKTKEYYLSSNYRNRLRNAGLSESEIQDEISRQIRAIDNAETVVVPDNYHALVENGVKTPQGIIPARGLAAISGYSGNEVKSTVWVGESYSHMDDIFEHEFDHAAYFNASPRIKKHNDMFPVDVRDENSIKYLGDYYYTNFLELRRRAQAVDRYLMDHPNLSYDDLADAYEYMLEGKPLIVPPEVLSEGLRPTGLWKWNKRREYEFICTAPGDVIDFFRELKPDQAKNYFNNFIGLAAPVGLGVHLLNEDDNN